MSRTTRARLPDHHDPRGGFRNPWPSAEPHGLREFLRWMRTYDRRPDATAYGSLPRATPGFARPHAGAEQVSLTWIGHSTFLIQLGGCNVLTDPMWSRRASPVQFAGPGRLMPPGVGIDELPPIDLVVQSHDHYDHLDDGTVRQLAARHPEARWLVSLGLESFVRARGVRRAGQLDWWDEAHHDGLRVVCTPTQHFSGRSFRRNRTLWAGWVIAAAGRTIYFVGDTGYFPGLAAVARRLGPFDAALVPIGAYDPRWFMRPAHLDPEEAVRVYRELTDSGGAERPCPMVAMHWGTFKLTEEPLLEPPARARRAWREAGLPPAHLWIFEHGETRWL